MGFVIAIDGPAGSGKTTTAKISARQLGMIYLDTGAMYRAVALYMIEKGINIDNEEAVKNELNNIKLTFDKKRNIFLNDRNVSGLIRNEEISQGASKVSVHPSVRSFLVDMQRKIGHMNDIVAEGRDMGTVVFPDAPLKFFIKCSIDERARRRYNDYLENGNDITLDELKQEIEKRDERDSTRKYAPLRMADDAILIDTTNLSKEEQIDIVVKKAETVRENL